MNITPNEIIGTSVGKRYCNNCMYGYLYSFCKAGVPAYTDSREAEYRTKYNSHGDCKHYKRKWWKVWVR